MNAFHAYMRKKADIALASDTPGSQVTGANDNPMRSKKDQKLLQPWMRLAPDDEAPAGVSSGRDAKGEGTVNGDIN